MLSTYRLSSLLRFVFAASLMATTCVTANAEDSQIDSLKRTLVERTIRLHQAEKALSKGDINILVNRGGNEQDAKNYYARIAPLINFSDSKDNLENSTLDTLLGYLGFAGLKGVDLEILDSAILMPNSSGDFSKLSTLVSDPAGFASNKRVLSDFNNSRVLVSRFFAPKIVNFNAAPNPNPKLQNLHTAGWRKLVRVVPTRTSRAWDGGIRQAYILMNYFHQDTLTSPFPAKAGELKPGIESGNNQVILVPKTFSKTSDSAYFIVYQPFSKQYALGYSLNAAFDTTGPGEATTQNYFVPVACVQCHGHDLEIRGENTSGIVGPFPLAKPNFLDTDQWYDTLVDFEATRAGQYDVVFDGGKAHDTRQYRRAIDIFRILNTDIEAHYRRTMRDRSDNFKLAAVQKWLSLHSASSSPVPIHRRALSVNGGPKWARSDAVGVELLSRYCYRCHSSMYYSIFDKAGVFANRKAIPFYIDNDLMPQGRLLSDPDRSALLNFIASLK